MASKKRTKEALIIMAGQLHADRMISKKDGTFETRWGFFYRHGRSSRKIAWRVGREVKGIKVVNHFEHLDRWPKDSYWAVRIEIADADVLVAQAEDVCKKYKCEWAELVKETKEGWE